MTSDKRPRGRPTVPPDQRITTPVRTLRLSDAHWAELQARGGAQALRDWLNKPLRKKAAAGHL